MFFFLLLDAVWLITCVYADMPVYVQMWLQ
jgi:hypothetical protein